MIARADDTDGSPQRGGVGHAEEGYGIDNAIVLYALSTIGQMRAALAAFRR